MTDGALRRGLRRAVWGIGAALAALLAIAGVFAGLTGGVGGAGDPDAQYETVAVERGDLRETVVASGTIEPLVRVPVIAEVSGIIYAVHVEEGERVARGQPLFELDRERLAARVAEVRAQLDLRRANARYDLVGRAEAERDHLAREAKRVSALFDRNVASDLDRERAEHALRLAEISLSDAHAESAARQAAVAQGRELLRQAERDLENAIVRAPIDGIVIERVGEVGLAVADVTSSGGTMVAVIADDRRIRLLAEIDENDIAHVQVGQTALVSIDAFPDEEFSGRVRKISSAGRWESNVANFEIEIELAPDERLRVGMSSDARVVVREHHAVLLVPNLAIEQNGSGAKVRRAAPAGEAPPAPVQIRAGYSDGFQTVIQDGLDEGDLVLVRSGDA